MPWFLVWGALPALLLLAGTLSPIAHPDSSYASIGTTLSNIALHGGPAILYGWSGFLLRYRRVRLWWLLAVPHGALMVVLNISLVAFLFPFVASLAR